MKRFWGRTRVGHRDPARNLSIDAIDRSYLYRDELSRSMEAIPELPHALEAEYHGL
jgi:hypothetical protein